MNADNSPPLKRDIIGGDQINQTGNFNIGKIDQRSGTTTNSFSMADSSQAVGELAEFIAYLERTGVISGSGRVTDVTALEAAVAGHESRLRRVATAIASGADTALTKAVDHVAAPLILAIVDRYFT